jgi:methionine synthase I (cobalamin-dependent)/5,10-methylenetetrahydrofolate reductase
MEKRMTLAERLKQGIVIADGAMGTMLYQHGAFLNTCFEELNLTRPELVAGIHEEYVAAGADFVESNTYGANTFKLARFGLAERVEQIISAAVGLARRAASDKALVAGSMGPLGIDLPQVPESLRTAAYEAFAAQGRTLHSAGADFLLLETFSSVDELLLAIEAVSDVSDKAIVVQMACESRMETRFGTPIEEAIAAVESHPAVVAVGLNCLIGPSDMLEAVKKIRTVTAKPLSVQPNAGLPRQVEGRMLYMCTPEYMAEYAKRFFEAGVKIIGGCCGTTPAHIRQIAKAVRPLDKATAKKKTSVAVLAAEPKKEAGFEAKPLGQKSRLGEKIANGMPVYCVELTPPKGTDTAKLIASAKLCAEYGIDAVNIPDGPRASARLSPLVSAVKIQQAADIETILHVCCRDKNIIGLQSDLLGIEAMGIKNVLLITGDPPKLGEYPDATAVFDLDSISLVKVVQNLNRGLDIAGNALPGALGLTVGVGANPAASEMHREIERFVQKARAGAEYAITQPVFDVEMFYAFQAAVENCDVPLIAGIWPFTSYKNAEFMANEVPGVVVPAKLLERMSKAKTQQDGRKIGIEIAREMIELLSPHVAGFAVSAPFGNVKLALATLNKMDTQEL